MAGLGLSLFEEVLVAEELSWGCSGISTALSANGLGWLPIAISGSNEQKEDYGGRLVDGQLCAYCVTEPGSWVRRGRNPNHGRA